MADRNTTPVEEIARIGAIMDRTDLRIAINVLLKRYLADIFRRTNPAHRQAMVADTIQNLVAAIMPRPSETGGLRTPPMNEGHRTKPMRAT